MWLFRNRHQVIRVLIISFLILHSSFFILQGQDLQKVGNKAFIRGEKFKFRAYYDSFLTGKVTAGEATLEVREDAPKINGRNTFHVIGEGKSKGAFNLFFKVDDIFETFMDEEFLVPWYFIRKTHEGSYRKDDEVRFNQYSKTASSKRANKSIPSGIQDVISAFYFTRSFDFSSSKIGETFPVTYFLDDSVYFSVIQFAGREDITIGLGTFHCLRFKPMLVTGNVFSQPYAMDIWITDDANHVPLLAVSAVIIGSVKLELITFDNLANPVTSQIAGPKKK
ncbi:MAG: DUF3108 domain-containing protein [Bacteroidetes bacterium]|nr:DUF3108 domain-containing protein [Bacteroidota bacterium]